VFVLSLIRKKTALVLRTEILVHELASWRAGELANVFFINYRDHKTFTQFSVHIYTPMLGT
jgi:hypothetical protein